MPKLSELVDQAFGREALSADTARLKTSYAGAEYPGRGETLGEAAKNDISGLSSVFDPTSPANLVHHAVPIALQMGATALAGPEGGVLAKTGLAGLGSLLGYLYQSGAEPLAAGKSPTTTLPQSVLNVLLGAGFEGGAQLGGAAARQLTGKSAMLSEGEKAAADAAEALSTTRTGAELEQKARLADVAKGAEAEALAGQEAYDQARTGAMQEQAARTADVGKAAEGQALADRAKAAAKVQTRQTLIDQQVLKHQEDALAGLSAEEVEQKVKAALGAPPPIDNPTIESLSARTTPVRESVQRNVRGVFSGISQKFEEKLQPYYETPVEGNFAAAVDAERANLETNKETVGKTLQNLMNQVAALDPKAAVNVDQLPPALKREYELLQRSGHLNPDQLDAHMKQIAAGLQGPQATQAADAFAPPTVKRIDELRRGLTKIVISDGSGVERRVANRLIQNIDQNLESVLPENIRADWTNLRREWHEANAAFSPRFKSMLFNTSTPAKVADVLYGAAKGKDADRVLMVIGKTPADEIPLLRSAFAERLTQGDVVKNVQGMDKRVFKALYSGTGFEDPKAWVDTLGKGLDLQAVTKDPALYARFNARFQDGLKSFGMKKYQAALDRAEAQLRATPDPGKVMQDAMANELTPAQAGDVAMRGKTRPDVGQAKAAALAGEYTETQAGEVATAGMVRPEAARTAAEMQGMKTPLLGKGMQTYIERRETFRTALALASLGSAGGEFVHHPVIASIPLIFLGSSKVANMALSNPTFGRLWYSALKSPTLEQSAFWLGRLAAASMTETARSAP